MQSLGRYEGLTEISAALGGGSDAIVYKATEQASGQVVALKVLTKNPQPLSVERFRQEAALLSGLDHPNIVKVLATPVLSASEPPYYYVMQFLDGQSLSARLKEQGGSLSLAQFAPIFGQLADALAYIHARDIFHLDVKPNNVFLSHNDFSTLIDFGISCGLDGEGPSKRRAGTLAYASPEQVLGIQYSSQSDIFSLAALTYEVLSGCHPFTAGSVSQITDEILRGKEKPLHLLSADIPMALSVCLARALSKDPKHRYGDILSFAQDFEQAAKSKS